MNNVIQIPTLVARSSSVRIREFRALERIATCTSYVLGWVKSEAVATSKSA
jgi:hypothetical protein